QNVVPIRRILEPGASGQPAILADVGSVTPHLGGSSMRYDPLPASMVSRRRRLRFVYFDGGAASVLTLGEVRELAEA
ncbi:MAG: hypothetical protein WA196_14045, partial [Pseudolabrys sp.]